MDKKTVDKLNELNKKFYLKTQVYFNRTREYYWAGWKKLLPYLPVKKDLQRETLQVLDVGCGNARFGKFLEENDLKIEYTGMDNNQYLLDKVDKKLSQAELINQDILKTWKIQNRFDLIVFFGILHHVPGLGNRIRILKTAKNHLRGGGLLVFTLWQFKNIERLKKKIVKNHKLKGLEKNDYILKWEKGEKANRYCHFVDKKELKKILSELNMELIDEFEADAKEGQGNKYIILKQAG